MVENYIRLKNFFYWEDLKKEVRKLVAESAVC